jgi:aminoglycoside phosphotransferase (APT) family kinase protein
VDFGSLGRWVELSLGRPCVLGNVELISRGPEREVWDIDVEDHSLVLTLFLPGDRSSVNTSLPPAEVARKCHLAMTDLRKSGLPTPNVVGSAVEASAAALATRRETERPWSRGMRGEAAELLTLLHAVPPGSLSAELGALVRSSDSRHDRVRVGLRQMTAQLDRARRGWRIQHPDVADHVARLREKPVSALPPTLVHGDYFSANLLATANGLVIADWETLALGDPMADLGWLVGADRGLDELQVGSVVKAYANSSPVDESRLCWWRSCWAAFWELRDLTTNYRRPLS